MMQPNYERFYSNGHEWNAFSRIISKIEIIGIDGDDDDFTYFEAWSGSILQFVGGQTNEHRREYQLKNYKASNTFLGNIGIQSNFQFTRKEINKWWMELLWNTTNNIFICNW